MLRPVRRLRCVGRRGMLGDFRMFRIAPYSPDRIAGGRGDDGT